VVTIGPRRNPNANPWPLAPKAPAKMSFWQDKVALVTGGSSGLGRWIADAFAAAGAKVAVVGLEADAVRQTEDQMRSAGRDVLGIAADITRQEDVDAMLAETLERFGRLDVLVNNAGRSMRGQLLDTTPDEFRALMELNLIALVRCTRAAAPELLVGGQVGGPLGGGLSGHKARRGGLFAAASAGAGVPGPARAPGLSGAHRARRPAALSFGRPGRPPRVCTATRGGSEGRHDRPRKTRPRDSPRLPAPPAGTSRPRQSPLALRPRATLAHTGRLDRAAKNVARPRHFTSPPALCRPIWLWQLPPCRLFFCPFKKRSFALS
jgi:NAD(P)-dependent dehydrogenase (short-subunit alcohol dehydrogenase family)